MPHMTLSFNCFTLESMAVLMMKMAAPMIICVVVRRVARARRLLPPRPWVKASAPAYEQTEKPTQTPSSPALVTVSRCITHNLHSAHKGGNQILQNTIFRECAYSLLKVPTRQGFFTRCHNTVFLAEERVVCL